MKTPIFNLPGSNLYLPSTDLDFQGSNLVNSEGTNLKGSNPIFQGTNLVSMRLQPPTSFRQDIFGYTYDSQCLLQRALTIFSLLFIVVYTSRHQWHCFLHMKVSPLLLRTPKHFLQGYLMMASMHHGLQGRSTKFSPIFLSKTSSLLQHENYGCSNNVCLKYFLLQAY